MSEIPNDLHAVDENSEVGMTSDESSLSDTNERPWYYLDLFNTLLLISLLLITLSSLLLFWHLFDRFGPVWELPWNV